MWEGGYINNQSKQKACKEKRRIYFMKTKIMMSIFAAMTIITMGTSSTITAKADGIKSRWHLF